MKKLVLLMVAGSILMFCSSAWAVITGSAHDFSGVGWNTGGEICIVCHTPHNSVGTNAPLWNHTETAATFTLYTDTGTLDATDVSAPSGVSKLCLSCHDGTVALDSFTGAAGTASGMISGDALIGTDLSNDHPVSFTYNTALATADGDLVDPLLAGSSGIGTTISADLLFGAANDKVECASCHDVHNADSLDKLLRKANTGSALCLTCHSK